ncbi:MAG: hypothetical protein RLZZ331_1604 [Pseudomonadota bacterium]
MALPTRSVWAPAGALAGLLLLVAAAPPAVDYRAPGDETGLPGS